ncbi:unnamed protein product [Ranitomeya imitator]|uniref:Reverse transcriptase domain-containing protein n=1 Tax=Ranitomeya imitator TaxID=111125 RepID=A0ABN9LS30_9NEOB|nr:unnamed protein product [Ranitomeya imitator]
MTENDDKEHIKEDKFYQCITDQKGELYTQFEGILPIRSGLGADLVRVGVREETVKKEEATGLVVMVHRNTGPLHGSNGEVLPPTYLRNRVARNPVRNPKEPGKYRLIHHLSYPKGRSVNDGIPDDDTAVTYIPFDRAVEMGRKAGPGALMAKSDIESAFRLLPVHPDCYHLTFLEWVARKVTRLPSITHYLDDFLLVDPANSDVCYHALVQFKDVMSCFGVPLSPDKTIGPVSVITFLGIEIDSVAMEFRLPQDKIAKLLDLIAGCLAVGKVTLVQMQSLLGSLNFACKVMPMGRIFSRRLILGTKGVKQPHHRIRITAQLRSDLIIWQRFLFSYNGKTCFQEDECDSDSLGLRLGTVDTVGFSVSFRDQTCADTWPESCGMVGSRGYSSKFWDALIRSGMSWRADSSVKVFHRSFHLESIRWYAAQHMAGGPFLHILGSTACGVIPRRSFVQSYRDGRHLAWNKRSNVVTSPAGSCARIARVASSPTVVVIHAGGNDLASFPLAELLTLMRADLDKLPGFFPVMRLVWSELIPRLVWRGARELSAMERSRRTLNQRISHFIRFKNGVVVRHHRLEGDNSGFLLPDGVHLNDASLDIFLDGLREGVVQRWDSEFKFQENIRKELHGNQGKHRVTKRGPVLSYTMFTLVTGIVGRWRAIFGCDCKDHL